MPRWMSPPSGWSGPSPQDKRAISMILKILKTGLMACAACALMSVSALAMSQGTATVNASALNLRSEPSTDSEIVTVAPRGAVVIISDADEPDGWSMVWYKGYVGYMSDEYITKSETGEANFGIGAVYGTSVRMRSGPGTDYSILGTFNTGDEMSVTGVSGQWYRVTDGTNEGYIRSDYFSLYIASRQSYSSTTPESDQVSESSSEGEKIVETAKKYLGTPYVWAGTSPSGFDCSGFVYYVYRECGYSINRTAESIYLNGEYVDRSSLQPGDVICFTTGSSSTYIGHVGIYIGDGQFIHASSGTGYVTISSLSETYYNTHYYGARRIVS